MLLSKLVEEYLKNENLSFESQEEKTVFQIPYSAANGDLHLYIMVDDERNLLVTHTLFPLKVPKEQLAAEIALISKINSQIALGNFELNREIRYVVFRNSLLLGDVPFHSELLSNLMAVSLETVDEYWLSMASVAFNNISAETILNSNIKDSGISDDDFTSNENNRNLWGDRTN